MTETWDKLTVPEAAAVACVSVRDVNRLYDEKIFPEDILLRSYVRHDHDRFVSAWACALIAFYFNSAEKLTASERIKAISAAEHRVNETLREVFISFWKHSIFHKTNLCYKTDFYYINKCQEMMYIEFKNLQFQNSFLTIDWEPFVCKVADRLIRLSSAKQMVETSHDVLCGTPVISGTRVPVYDVAASVEKGISIDRILDAYPSLNREQVELATFYAKAVPPRGRRRKRDLPKGATIIADRRIPRRKEAK